LRKIKLMHSLKSPSRSGRTGLLLSLASVVLLSFNYVTAKYALRAFNSTAFSLLWTACAASYSFLIIVASGKLRELAIRPDTVLPMALLGVVTFTGMLMGWKALSLLDPSFYAFLARFGPVLLIVMSTIFLRERLALRELLPITVMVAGGCVSVAGRWQAVGLGVIVAILACSCVAVQNLIAKLCVKKMDARVIHFYRNAIGALLLLIFVFGLSAVRSGFSPTESVQSFLGSYRVGPSYWLVACVGAFLGPCCGVLLGYASYRYWDLSRYGIVLTMQPMIVVPLAYIFLGKFPDLKEFAGGCMILLGALWLAWIHLRRQHAAAK